ncbi:832765af-b219-43ae-8d63-44daeca45cab [Sclerotinia trifoliorum]|uniref:832765af-b219-43ae-8d63-44daeca45cab n=1 Tax=Sclerotinia trifoliorum TaxID=28548 RepID=A0A8H2W434_9HELO|nr:832765af-b219-43ae-8d63-44daeca45cab [Sclerotinia trifoliorum]
MPTGALSISMPNTPNIPTITTKHSATRPTFFPTVAWWKSLPRPSFTSYYSSNYNIRESRDDTHDENGRRVMEEGLLSEGEREDFDGVIAGVGMGDESGSSYWKMVSDEGRRRGKLRLVVEVLGGVGVVVAVVGLALLIFG